MSYYLYDHPNPHAAQRSNGIKFWGYPTRRGATGPIDPTFIVVHTAENIPDFNPPDTGAENIARYFAGVVRPCSAHVVTDSDSTIPLLPDDATAFHVIGYNTRGWGIEIATQAASWAAVPDWHRESLLRNAAKECARVAGKYNIPIRFLTKPQIDAGQRGFTGHTNLDPARRRDPGFTPTQWEQFLSYVTQATGDDMAFTEHETEQLKNLVLALDHESTTGYGFAKWGSRLIDRERDAPVHVHTSDLHTSIGNGSEVTITGTITEREH